MSKPRNPRAGTPKKAADAKPKRAPKPNAKKSSRAAPSKRGREGAKKPPRRQGAAPAEAATRLEDPSTYVGRPDGFDLERWRAWKDRGIRPALRPPEMENGEPSIPKDKSDEMARLVGITDSGDLEVFHVLMREDVCWGTIEARSADARPIAGGVPRDVETARKSLDRVIRRLDPNKQEKGTQGERLIDWVWRAYLRKWRQHAPRALPADLHALVRLHDTLRDGLIAEKQSSDRLAKLRRNPRPEGQYRPGEATQETQEPLADASRSERELEASAKSSRGAPRKPAPKLRIIQGIRLYHQLTGEEAGLQRDTDAGDGYSGNLFHFVVTYTQAVYKGLAPRSIGREAEDAFKKVVRAQR